MNIIEKTLSNLSEKPLSVSARRARGRMMKRLAPKLAMKRAKALKKKASPEKLALRAKKAAKDIIRGKILKDKKYNDLAPAQKINVDKQVEKKTAAIAKIAKKLLPSIKKAEKERLAAMNAKEESIKEVQQPTPKAANDFKDIHTIEIYD